jgi:hypothetical protein
MLIEVLLLHRQLPGDPVVAGMATVLKVGPGRREQPCRTRRRAALLQDREEHEGEVMPDPEVRRLNCGADADGDGASGASAPIDVMLRRLAASPARPGRGHAALPTLPGSLAINVPLSVAGVDQQVPLCIRAPASCVPSSEDVGWDPQGGGLWTARRP